MKEIYKKLRKYELRIRKAINTQMHGDFHSIFKGSGLEHDDIRSYQYGDDIRRIDWNTSAKGHGTFIKTFKEEKEQNIFFILDVSASQNIGSMDCRKIDIGKEICGVLAFSGVKESSSVGLLCCSDQKELYIKPNKGIKHAYQLINRLFTLKTKSLKTNLNKACALAQTVIKRKSIIVIISDFIDKYYERNLKSLAKKHDLIMIHLKENRETNFPDLGIIPLYDNETKKTVWANTSSSSYRKKLVDYYQRNKFALKEISKKTNSNYITIDTAEDYVPKLVKLFKVRNHLRR